MCRLLYARSERALPLRELLAPFAALARNSREYQGHGWGCAWRAGGEWHIYRNLAPVWEDDLAQFGTARILLAHARSAFRDEGITVENNMPFAAGDSVFAFNGELNGVRIREQGRIGAEKIFNYIRRFDRGDKLAALSRGTQIIEKRTRYVRAMNIVLAHGEQAWLASRYNEDPDYFQLHCAQRDGLTLLCSQPFAGETHWQPVANGTVRAI